MLEIRTNAKVNLSLRVLGRRGDGFHAIESVFQTIDLADTIEVSDRPGAEVTVAMGGPAWSGSAAPPPGGNLVEVAARALVAAGAEPTGTHFRIDKRIPVGAGLGGGSANAAGALVVLNERWGLGAANDTLRTIAATVGSDVPYCLEGGTALVTGRGENVAPLPAPSTFWLVLGLSGFSLLTGEVYDMWDQVGEESDSKSASVTYALGAGDPAELAPLLHNDLELAALALHPELSIQKQALLDAGSLGACLSGSGPTLFGLAESEDHAHSIAAQVKDRFDRVEVVSTRPSCIEREGDGS
ncbi:MAG TPA: 4-(cytidine 5'-diphospho)-2-C-methyl-D-erythritol kinase [Actinomycetota bacterium]|nr:4-(cytidine 5'-diphospho)-2-C-methyl-D-erythritol kinase [Actinomycetota bacterium]